MKCLNCGGTEFEKAAMDGKFTTSFRYEYLADFTSYKKNVIVPRYFHACLKCGLVHQMLDLDARREEMRKLIDYALENRLTELDREDDRNFRIERISMSEVSECTKIPRPLLDQLVGELLQGHKGYDTRGTIASYQNDLIPVLDESDGELWIMGKKA